MQLAAVTPHPEYVGALEIHHFACERCGRTQNYTLRRDHATNYANARPRGDKRYRRAR